MKMAVDSSIQRITRLTPLGAILALIEARVGAVKPQKSPIGAARDFTLAEDVVSSEQPPRPIALRDGFPVDAATVADAGPYAPVPLPLTVRRIDAGEALPSDTDAVLPLDAVTLRGHRAEAVAAVTAGEGVLPKGGDATPRTPLRRAGQTRARYRHRGHGSGRNQGCDHSRAAHPHRLRWRGKVAGDRRGIDDAHACCG